MDMSGKPKVVSTFSGIGGSSQGYKQAGFNVIAGIEFVDFQAVQYKFNHPKTKLYQEDIREITAERLLKDLKLKKGELDILDGSPPCASFSISGNREKDWGKIKKYSNRKQRTDDLFFEYIRLVKGLKPKVVIAENVKGLTIGTAKGYLKTILRELENLGYIVKYKVLNSANYLVPQIRTRIFIIGVRKDLNKIPSYPTPSNKYISLKEAFKGLEFTEKDKADTDISKFAIFKELEKTKIGKSNSKYFNLLKANPYKPSNTITATCGNIGAAKVCHWDNRAFTIAELKRISSYPDNYKLSDNYSEAAEGIGRSVPPKLMEAIALNVKERILND